jgi:chromosome segregation ATPase
VCLHRLCRLVLARESISNFREKYGADAAKGSAASRMADLQANEKNLLQQQNDELKKLNELLRHSSSSFPQAHSNKPRIPDDGSALQFFGDQFDDRNNVAATATFMNSRLSLEEAVDMLKIANDKHAALQEQYLSLRSEITSLHYDLTNSEEKNGKLQMSIRELNFELERKRSQLAEKELQLAASIKLPPPVDSSFVKYPRDAHNSSANTTKPLPSSVNKVPEKSSEGPRDNEVIAAAEKQNVVSGMELDFHRQIQELLEEVRRKQSRIRELESKIEARAFTPFIGGASEWERRYIAQKAEAEEREAALQAQADSLLKICEERLSLLKLQEDHIKKCNSKIEDFRARLVSQAEALRNSATNTEMLERMLFEEKNMLEEAKRMRTIAEEQLIEAQKSHVFITEAKQSVEHEKERGNMELSKARQEIIDLQRNLDQLNDRHDNLNQRLKKEEGLGEEAEKWKSSCSHLESELLEVRAELRTLKRAEHDKTLGLETALVEREQSIRLLQGELDEAKRRARQYEHTLEDLTQSLSEALHREESIRKHSENIGLQMQVRLTEQQSRVGMLEDERGQLEKEVKTLRHQLDSEIAAAGNMWKKLEDNAIRERDISLKQQSTLDYNFRLENQVKMLKQQIDTLSLQVISHKSSYAFAAFRCEYLANNVTVLTMRAESAESKVAGAMDAAQRAQEHLRDVYARGTAPAAAAASESLVPSTPPDAGARAVLVSLPGGAGGGAEDAGALAAQVRQLHAAVEAAEADARAQRERAQTAQAEAQAGAARCEQLREELGRAEAAARDQRAALEAGAQQVAQLQAALAARQAETLELQAALAAAGEQVRTLEDVRGAMRGELDGVKQVKETRGRDAGGETRSGGQWRSRVTLAPAGEEEAGLMQEEAQAG